MDQPLENGPVRALAAEPPGGLRFMLRALRSRNYRLFFVGQGISLVGSWLSRVATAWLVFRLVPEHEPKHAAWLLGLLGFVSLVPVFVLTPLTGVLVDRWNRHRIMVITQILSTFQTLALAILTLGGWITIPQVMVLSLIQGLINAFDAPARQAFVVQMVDNRDDLANAIALNSSLFNGARLVGPAIGGVLIAYFGEGWCFLLDAISYIAVVGGLLAMRVPPHVRPTDTKHVLAELRDAVRYVGGFPPIRALLLLAATVSLMAMSFQTLMPAFADALAPTRERGAQMLGFLMGAVGVGSLSGAIYLASRHGVVGLGRVMAITTGVLSLSMIGFSFRPHLLLSMVLVAGCGFGMIVTLASSNTILQTLVDDRMRGRLMSFFTMAVMGMSPFGSLLAGWLASRLGEGMAVRITGICCGVMAVVFASRLSVMRRLVRPIYVRKGILPEVSVGLRTASTYNAPANG